MSILSYKTPANRPARSSSRTLKPGQILYREGDILSETYQVSSGWVKLSRTTLKGQNFIVDILFPGDYFDLSCFWGGGPSTLTATSLNLYSAELNCMTPEMLANPLLNGLFQQQMAARIRRQQETMVALATYKVEQKVWLGLQRLARRGGCRQGTRVSIPMPLTRQELGEWIGTTPESSIRALTDLQRQGSIQLRARDVLCRAHLLEEPFDAQAVSVHKEIENGVKVCSKS